MRPLTETPEKVKGLVAVGAAADAQGMSRWIAVVAAGVFSFGALTACASIPADPDGTLERVRETGVLRVGASPAEPLVDISGATPRGTLPETVRDYASSLGADVTWSVDSEERLVASLERGDLDVVIGGVTDASPWSSRATVTRSYPDLAANGSDPVALLTPLGENALLVSLEEYLDEVTR